jgi:hypothetical protein
VIVKRRDVDPAEQVTVAVAVPGSVLVPIRQLQVTFPAALAVALPSPRDSLEYPLGSLTARVHESLAIPEWALNDS